MGRQVRFYMMPADEQAFLAAIESLGDYEVIQTAVEHGEEARVQTGQLPSISPDRDLCFVRTGGRQNKFIYHPSPNGKVLCKTESDVVEFSRSRWIDDWLASGRLWFSAHTMSGQKAKDFISWAESLLRWVRRNYDRHSDGDYIGPEAEKCRKNGAFIGASAKPPMSIEEQKRILGLL